MKPSLLCRQFDKGLFLISTTGGRILEGTPIYGKNDWGPEYFRINRFEKIPIESVRDAKEICDYYYSPTIAAESGFCTIDNELYTERVRAGSKPTCNVDDARFVKRTASDNTRAYHTKTNWQKYTGPFFIRLPYPSLLSVSCTNRLIIK